MTNISSINPRLASLQLLAGPARRCSLAARPVQLREHDDVNFVTRLTLRDRIPNIQNTDLNSLYGT
jgi:hypothetical protein